MTVLKNILLYILALCIIMAGFLGSILLIADNDDFYKEQYEKNNTTQHTGMSIDDLSAASTALLDYMFDRRDDINVIAEVNGTERAVFDERETLHMVDVKDLFLMVLYFFYALCAAGVIGSILVAVIGKKAAVKRLARAYTRTTIAFIIIAALLGVLFYFNFQIFWVGFHLLLFDNDLWILDPSVSIMINMFPLEFFFAMCTQILVAFVLFIAVTFAALNVTRIVDALKAKRARAK